MFNGNFINLLIYRSAAELKSEGTRTYAGYLWWILEPLMSLAVYYVAFKYILHRETENFAVFLFTGIVIYRFFAGTVTRSAGSILSGHGLMQLVYLHKSVFPLSVVLVNLVKFMVTMVLLIGVIWVSGNGPSWSYFALPLLIFIEVLFIAGVSLFFAAVTPFFPDFQLILGTIMHLLIFLSGVFHRLDTLSPGLKKLITLNPMAALIEQFRGILLEGRWPVFTSLIPAVCESFVILLIGGLLIHRYNRIYPKIGKI